MKPEQEPGRAQSGADSQTSQPIRGVSSEERAGLIGPAAATVAVVSFLYATFHFATAATGPLFGVMQYSIHLGFAVVLVLAYSPMRNGKPRGSVPVYDLLFIVLTLVAMFYALANAVVIMEYTYTENIWQVILGTILILLTLEAARRALGWIFPILVSLSILYALFGAYIPGHFGHRGFSWEEIVRTLYFSASGLWGIMLQISSTLVAVFLIFAAVLLKTGAGEGFIDIAFVVSARLKGGPAQMAAVASALFGTISGSAVANSAATGTFTIPLMKRAGFRPEFAAAVEATASTGGQIMPPIMGAGAFLMAQFLGISYAKVAFSALLPALLYYAALMFSIYLEAVRHKLPVLETEEYRQIRARLTIRRMLVPSAPVAVLIGFFVAGYTVQWGAFWATIAGIILSLFLVEARGLVNRLLNLTRMTWSGLVAGGKSIADIAVLIGSAQILVSMLGMTGVAVKASDMLVQLGREYLILTLMLAMLVLIILGMGVPPTAVYVLGAAIIAPALVKLGLDLLPVHMFTFYSACIGSITPPVCAAVYVTSAIANSNWWRTGWIAVRLGIAGFIVPYMFIFSPSLLMMGTPLEIAAAALPAFVGTFFLATFATGYFITRSTWAQRCIMAVAGVALVQPGWMTDSIGLLIAAAVASVQLLRRQKERRRASNIAPPERA